MHVSGASWDSRKSTKKASNGGFVSGSGGVGLERKTEVNFKGWAKVLTTDCVRKDRSRILSGRVG